MIRLAIVLSLLAMPLAAQQICTSDGICQKVDMPPKVWRAVKKIQRMNLSTGEALYVEALRRAGCRVDFNDRGAINRLFDDFIQGVYRTRRIPTDVQDNQWVEGQALTQKDTAYFSLKAKGIAAFDEKSKIMTLRGC